MGFLVAASLNASIMGLVPGLVGPVSGYCDWVGYSSCATLDFPVWHSVSLVSLLNVNNRMRFLSNYRMNVVELTTTLIFNTSE